MKRAYFGRQIRGNSILTDEVEYGILDKWLKPGDWAVDVGANIGHCTKRMSELVGPRGRVFAFEPTMATVDLLSSNAARFCHDNISLLNLAASDACRLVHMELPSFETGAANYYQPHITSDGTSTAVMSVHLAKFEPEGHER